MAILDRYSFFKINQTDAVHLLSLYFIGNALIALGVYAFSTELHPDKYIFFVKSVPNFFAGILLFLNKRIVKIPLILWSCFLAIHVLGALVIVPLYLFNLLFFYILDVPDKYFVFFPFLSSEFAITFFYNLILVHVVFALYYPVKATPHRKTTRHLILLLGIIISLSIANTFLAIQNPRYPTPKFNYVVEKER